MLPTRHKVHAHAASCKLYFPYLLGSYRMDPLVGRYSEPCPRVALISWGRKCRPASIKKTPLQALDL
jgi:hypothetical protein